MVNAVEISSVIVQSVMRRHITSEHRWDAMQARRLHEASLVDFITALPSYSCLQPLQIDAPRGELLVTSGKEQAAAAQVCHRRTAVERLYGYSI